MSAQDQLELGFNERSGEAEGHPAAPLRDGEQGRRVRFASRSGEGSVCVTLPRSGNDEADGPEPQL